MSNEVRIKVKAYDETSGGFDKARLGANKTASDIEGEFEKSGKSSGDKFGSGILARLQGLAPEGVPMIANIGVAAAPLLGAAISGAIIGGAGIGGVLGGVTLAAKDPRVQAAGSALSKNLMGSLQQDAKPFIQPVLGAIGQIQAGFDAIRPHIQNIFANSAQFITPLVNGLTNGIGGIAGGIDSLVAKAGPVIGAIGGMFDKIGRSVGDALTTISGDSEDSAQALDDLGGAISVLIEGLGYVVRGLTEAYGGLHDFADGIVSAGRAVGIFNEQQSEMGEFAHHAGGSLKAETAAVNDQAAALRKLSDEMKAQTDPLFALINGEHEVADAQKAYNRALDQHGPKSEQAKDALTNLGKAAFGLQSDVAAAAGGFNGKLTPAMKTSLRNAGLNASEIKKLEGQLKSAAKAANAWEGTFTQTYNVKTVYSTDGSVGGQDAAMARRRASGGVMGAATGGARSGLTWVGENGPELADLPAGATVHSAGDSARMAAAGTGNGGQPIVVKLMLDGIQVAQAIVDPLRNQIRGQGGNVQTVLGQPGR